jgi:hypothetical protein
MASSSPARRRSQGFTAGDGPPEEGAPMLDENAPGSNGLDSI